MDKVVEILIRRDGLAKEEAEEHLRDVLDDVQRAINDGDFSLAEDIWLSEMSLEVDYLMEALI